MNINQLRDQEFIEFAKQEMKWFYKISIQPDIKMQTIWDASKAYLRGIVIGNASKLKKIQEKKMKEIIQKFKQEEKSFKFPENERIRKKIEKLQHEINVQQTAEMGEKIKIFKVEFFENANKSGRWLAYKLKKERQKNQIQALKDEFLKEKTKIEHLKVIVENFYEELYREQKLDNIKQEEYLKCNNVLETIRDSKKEPGGDDNKGRVDRGDKETKEPESSWTGWNTHSVF